MKSSAAESLETCAAGEDSSAALPPWKKAKHAEGHSSLVLPACLSEFCAEHGIDVAQFASLRALPRFLRLRSRFECSARTKTFTTVQSVSDLDLRRTVKAQLEEWLGASVEWSAQCGEFARVSEQSESSVARFARYADGTLTGMDLASGLCALVVDPQCGEDVLDLCCAPGAKFEFLCELQLRSALAAATSEACAMAVVGTVTGVDLAEHRLQKCRKRVRAAGLFNARLFRADGCEFAAAVPSNGERMRAVRGEFADSLWHVADSCLTAKQRKVRRRRHRRSGLPALCDSSAESEATLFDKVLVDAQCTHDGSLRHVRKFLERGDEEGLARTTLSAAVVADTVALQRRLLAHGFSLLKPGGSLVYATCSLTRCQNEDVVAFLLEQCTDARLCDLSEHSLCRDLPENDWMPGTIRMNPLSTGTSGLFIAKVAKSSVVSKSRRKI